MSDYIPDQDARTAAEEAAAALTTIRPAHGWRFPDLPELLEHRDLLWFLVVRNIKVRYRQTLLGGAWAIIQPLATMAIMTVVFGRLIGIPSENVPYWAFALSGLVLWTFVTQTISAASSSLVNSAQLIEKTYFPRLAIPLAAVAAGLIDFAISFAMLLVVIVAAGFDLDFRIFFALVAVLLAAILCVGLGAALAAIAVRYRDIQYIVPLALQLWLFATPIVYPISIVPERYRSLLALNPATALVDLFRWATLGTATDPWRYLPLSLASLAVVLVAGLLLFRRMERSFADLI